MANIHSQMSPRQKMINLMYIVLTAMLALNVSSDVLDGFTQVDNGLKNNNEALSERNDAIYNKLEFSALTNPEKAGAWYTKASELKDRSAKLYEFIDSLKVAIVIEADGKKGNINDIKNRENLDAASIVMLNPINPKGTLLKTQLDNFRTSVLEYIDDSLKYSSINNLLSTEDVIVRETGSKISWENYKFENQPVVAAVTLLTKLQNDVISAEGEALTALLSGIDANDLRVNELQAFVIPESRIIMRGTPYSAEIILAAVDTTARPNIYIDGKDIESKQGHYEFYPTQSGFHSYTGYLEVPMGDGSLNKQYFTSNYTVIEPTATISSSLMNVLYSGIDNPIDIAVPGIVSSQVRATMKGGNISKDGDKWIAVTNPDVNEATIVISAEDHGRYKEISSHTFKVRNLPDPTAYISVGSMRYKGDKPISKADLLSASGLGAAIDDGILDVNFAVKEFETIFFDSMGNAMLERSDGTNFSNRQKESFKRLNRGKRFFISRIKAIGPDGKERILNPIEIVVN